MCLWRDLVLSKATFHLTDPPEPVWISSLAHHFHCNCSSGRSDLVFQILLSWYRYIFYADTDTFFMLIQARWASKCLSELSDPPAVLLFFVELPLFVEVVEIWGQKKVESMLQYCWARMGCPHCWTLQHLYNQISEHREDGLAESFLQWQLINLCPQHHTSPESPNPVIFPKPSIFQGHVQSQACNYGCDRPHNEW